MAPNQAAPVHQSSDIDAIVSEVNTAFGNQWAEQRLQAAPPALEWAVTRRISLALTGTIPSLEEMRNLEPSPEGQRVTWWLEHLFKDRRYADYFAERFARAYVGTEDGPFIIYRRRRFVSWLSDQFFANRLYGDLVRELITSDGLWTDHPATNFITV